MSIHPKIFLSHSHRDRHSATDLQIVLETQGAETYLDQDKIQAGDILPERIREGISWCDTFLLIWSSSAAVSVWVGKEWNTAYDLRKKIIPYSLDSTPLPAVLQNLVRVEADDREHGDANLLMAVFGRDFTPDPTTLFPGNWHASVDAFGMTQGTYDLELRANGQVEGNGGISNSGLAGQIAREMGMSGLLTMRIPIHGAWSYDRKAQILTIKTSVNAFGQQQNDIIRIRTTGREAGAISGEDLGGRVWTLRRVSERAQSRPNIAERQRLRAEQQKLRDGLQRIYDTAGHTPVFGSLMLAYLLGFEKKTNCDLGDLGLPTEKINRLRRQALQTNQDQATWQAAVEDLMDWLWQAGWIKG